MSKYNRLSHSQVSRYSMCPTSYKYHYVDRIRTTVQSAALVFGGALDGALNCILTGEGDAEIEFDKGFTRNKVNDVEVYLPTCLDLVYANTDFDSDLLESEDYEFVNGATGQTLSAKMLLEAYANIKEAKLKSGYQLLPKDKKLVYNLMNWCSLKRKGLLMLKAYRKKVMPNIEKVHTVQKYVSLKNADGDSFIGYVDLVADYKGHGTVIFDNKTSAMEYEEDSVISSAQLATYTHILEDEYKTRKAGYIVLRKSVIKNRKKICAMCEYDGSGARHKTCSNIIDGKRCDGDWIETIDPDIHIQIIISEIPPQTEAIVMENIDSVNSAIKAEVFPRNFNSCTNWYGGKCPYFDLCYKNKMTGLVKKD